ncbi:MAG: SBBP repeat-containing protein [Deltaproteobacteria bacterium]|nr:SBBP repeat-containing protein [Deltaproteobacteria bacterium]
MKTSRIFGLFILLFAAILSSSGHALVSNETVKARVVQSYGKLPLSFERNEGHVNERVKFLAHWGERVYWFTPKEVVLDFSVGNKSTDKAASLRPAVPSNTKTKRIRHAVRISFPGSNPNVHIEGLDQQPGRVNYFIGNDKNKWRTNVPIYRGVIYWNIWDGIDLRYEGRGGNLKYEFVVAPGADPGVIRLAYAGIEGLRVSDSGDLVVSTKVGNLIEARPLIYQVEKSQKKEIKGTYRIMESGQVGFSLADYNSSIPLIIDPLVYSTYLGGSDRDQGCGIAVDDAGNAYVIGYAGSTGGESDVFVTKLNPSGSAVIYSTYLGGSGIEEGLDIAVDSSGNAYITGETKSTDFPTASPYQATSAGGDGDAFVAKLSESGSTLIYSTYLGGSDFDYGTGIAIDELGNVYIIGRTRSTNFPTSSPFQANLQGPSDAFVTRFNAAGSALIYSTYLGGTADEKGLGMAIDQMGNAYVTGWTYSTDFPTVFPYQVSLAGAGSDDAYVTKFNENGEPIYSTYLGGSGDDMGSSIAVDRLGNAYITGETKSTDFPTVNPYQPSYGGGHSDAFVTKLNADGSSLIYSTYIGGSGSNQESSIDIVVDELGSVYITGYTSSKDFPTVFPDQAENTSDWDGEDGFVTKLNSAGSALIYSTYLGGRYGDHSRSIAVDGSGDVYVTGRTGSSDFPTVAAYQSGLLGSIDAFVTKIHIDQIGSGNLVGEVKDDNTGNGIANASVTASGPDDYSTTTDENGNFSITDLIPGDYTVNASCSGCQCDPVEVIVPEGGTASVTIHCTQSVQPCILDMSNAQASFGCDSWGIPCLTIHNIGFFGQQFVVNWKMNLINGDWGIQGLGEGITNGIGILDFTEVQCNFSECVSMAIHNIQIFEQDYSLEWQLNMQTGDWEFAGIIMGTGAETTYGTIAGRVTRNSYGLGGITVTATYGIDTYASTTSRGNFFNPSTGGEYTLSVPVGTYEVRFSGSWYQTLCISNVTVTDNETVTLDVTIQRGSSSAECVPYSEYTGGTEGI